MAFPQSAPTAFETSGVSPRRVLIVGAAGRDFHNFNVVYRDDAAAHVVAFTAAQIPGIARRRYPATLAGALYPDGIPIEEEAAVERICREQRVDEVVFAYSDVPHEQVMHIASRALAAGADFRLLGPHSTMLVSSRMVIAVTALRTGCGKSQIARWLSQYLRGRGKRVAVLRHPMPYGDLVAERVQRFASLEDLDRARVTVEEREEYEPHLMAGNVVFAGVDYAGILAAAESEADIIIWDGGNNDFSFIRPDLNIAVADALRPTQVATHHPGETVARMADILVINKVDTANPAEVDALASRLRDMNPGAPIVRAASPVRLADPNSIRGKRILVVEDGPTITHGGMAYGAGYVAAQAGGAARIVDPRPFATPEISEVYQRYSHIGPVLPALGYNAMQRAALAATINATPADIVVAATPIEHFAEIKLPIVRARYEFAEAGEPTFISLIDAFLESRR